MLRTRLKTEFISAPFYTVHDRQTYTVPRLQLRFTDLVFALEKALDCQDIQYSLTNLQQLIHFEWDCTSGDQGETFVVRWIRQNRGCDVVVDTCFSEARSVAHQHRLQKISVNQHRTDNFVMRVWIILGATK